MEEKNKGLNINIEHYTGEKPIEVVYRLGDAAQAQQPLATKAPEKISVSGTISTPYEWLSKRIDTVDQKRANVVVNREKMTIQLTVNEDDYYNKNTFTGTQGPDGAQVAGAHGVDAERPGCERFGENAPRAVFFGCDGVFAADAHPGFEPPVERVADAVAER